MFSKNSYPALVILTFLGALLAIHYLAPSLDEVTLAPVATPPTLPASAAGGTISNMVGLPIRVKEPLVTVNAENYTEYVALHAKLVKYYNDTRGTELKPLRIYVADWDSSGPLAYYTQKGIYVRADSVNNGGRGSMITSIVEETAHYVFDKHGHKVTSRPDDHTDYDWLMLRKEFDGISLK
jgi:hypothetical protein